MWLLYELLIVLGFLLYMPGALWRKRLPHRGWSMRLGRFPRRVSEAVGARQCLWLHAVSVGEVLSAQPLVQALGQANPHTPIVLSTITPGGFEVASSRFRDRVIPIFLPLDLGGCIRRTLDVLHPRLLLLIESELWPNLLYLTHHRGVPIAVVNGRMSPRAFRRYRWIKRWLAGLLNQVDLFLMQSQEDANRLLELGAPQEKVRVVGSLKWDASLGARPSFEAIRQTAARVGLADPMTVIVAGSTHRGEEDQLLRAFQAVASSRPGLRMILAPRHMERVGEVERLAIRHGLRAVCLSKTPAAGPWDIGIVDTFGQLPAYYALADVVFIGGSLIPHGGQNPLEAASLGRPIIFGPSMHNFATIAHQLLAHHAARQLTDGEGLSPLLEELLTHPAEAQAMGRRAQELTERFQGATQRTLDALGQLSGARSPAPSTLA